MSSTVTDTDFDEIEEPSVLSSDPNERKLARRLRIQRRQEALQKLNDDEEEEEVVEESLTEKQILDSAEVLEKLIAEGNEVITNVRIANDARELDRRKKANEIREELLKQLEKNADDCRGKYEIINSKWPDILDSNDPLDINSEMEAQKLKCDEVLDQKNSAIAELKEAIKKADEKYFDDQDQQRDDIRLVIERIESQISTMENVYDRELDMIQKTLKTERNDLISTFKKKWDVLYQQQEDEDREGNQKRTDIMKEYEEEMEKIMTDHDEDFRAQKIQLESECQLLEQQVEKTKALCVMNEEKLEYNLMVLKSREEENLIIKNQQKKKINKLVGIINNLKKHYSELEENTKMEIEKLSKQILKAHRNIVELEEKSILFSAVNEKQYMDIWDMNTENANDLLQKILDADKIIHERTLGILWNRPEKTSLKKEDLESYCTAVEIIKKQKQEEAERTNIFEDTNLRKSLLEIKLEREVLNNILKQISNCSGYLIEDKLQELIVNCTEEEKTIIRLDNVFQALLISTPPEINTLLKYFLPYAYCPKCTNKGSTVSGTVSTLTSSESCADYCDGCLDEDVQKLVTCVKKQVELLPKSESTTVVSSTTKDDSTVLTVKSSDPCSEYCDECFDEDAQKSDSTKKGVKIILKDKSSTIVSKSESSLLNSFETEEKITILKKDSLASGALGSESSINEEHVSWKDDEELKLSKFTCEEGHILNIRTTHVTKAMKEVVTKYSAAEQKEMLSFEEKLRNKKFTISRNLSVEDVKNYWSSYREIFGERKEKLWDAILVGLNKYYEILKERHKYCTEIASLKKQNAELQKLLELQTGSPTDGVSLLQVKSAKHSSCK